jgi:4a-hydroxytetrahydrobiopterin dehydratase
VTLLSNDEIDRSLTSLPNWERVGAEITRTVSFPDFLAGIRFVTRVAELAEKADHHPDIDIRYRTIRFTLSTHDEGGLTQKDIDMARQIDRALG